MSAKEKDSKKKEDLKSFTVGSVPPSAGKGKKAAKVGKLQISEAEFPILAGLIKGSDSNSFRDELRRVLTAVEEQSKLSTENKGEAEKIQKAYGMAIAILENGKVIR